MRLRALAPSDAERVQGFVRGLSPRSRLERFFAPIQELSSSQLGRITSGKGLSLGAFDERGTLVALAEYARVDAADAELAVVVADEWQGQGVGEHLLAALLEHARRSGIARIEGVTRAGNRAMRLLARKLGFGFCDDADPDFVRFERALAG